MSDDEKITDSLGRPVPRGSGEGPPPGLPPAEPIGMDNPKDTDG